MSTNETAKKVIIQEGDCPLCEIDPHCFYCYEGPKNGEEWLCIGVETNNEEGHDFDTFHICQRCNSGKCIDCEEQALPSEHEVMDCHRCKIHCGCDELVNQMQKDMEKDSWPDLTCLFGCKQEVHPSSYLKFAMPNFQAFLIACNITHYRHNHLKSYNRSYDRWAIQNHHARAAYADKALRGKSWDEYKIMVNNRTKRQLARAIIKNKSFTQEYKLILVTEILRMQNNDDETVKFIHDMRWKLKEATYNERLEVCDGV